MYKVIQCFAETQYFRPGSISACNFPSVQRRNIIADTNQTVHQCYISGCHPTSSDIVT